MRCKTLAFLLSLALPAALLAGCGATADIADTATDETAAGETDAAESAADPYAYLADFDYSSLFDDKGYADGVTALDYVTLPQGYDAPTLPAGSDAVSDEEVDERIEQDVLSQYTETEQVTDRAAEMQDTVNIDYVGSVDGVEFDGGSTGGKGTTLQLTGTNYIDDFEEQIAGHKPGDSFDVVVTFPDPYQNNPDLAGKEAVFKTTLNYIEEQKLPELTDAFVAENLTENTGCSTVEELRSYFRDRMVYNKMASAVYSQLDETVIYADELPRPLTDFFSDWALYSPWQYASLYGIDLEEMLTQSGYESVMQYLEDSQEGIVSNSHQVLLVQAIAEDLGITCDDATMEARFADTFGANDIETMRERYGTGYLKMSVLEHLVMEKILENAAVAAE